MLTAHCATRSGRFGHCRQRREVLAVRRLSGVGLVRPRGVVKAQVAANAFARLAHSVVGVQVDLFVLHAAPQPLDEHGVPPAAATAHADGDALALEPLGEHHAGELQTLVGVENLRLAVTRDRLVEHAHAEVRFHRHRHVPGQDLAAMPVNDRGQIHEAARHRDVVQVHRPDLVRALDRQAAQQVRVDHTCCGCRLLVLGLRYGWPPALPWP